MDMKIKKEPPQQVKLVEVIQVITSRGAGTKDDPVRKIIQYWSKQGTLLAESIEN